jgi:broad specificity phosphatase PhoE
MPDASPDIAPSEWPLSVDGVRAAALLCAGLPRDARLIASTEPKAWQTLGGGDDVARDVRFREVDRPVEPWSSDFRARRAEYVAGARHPGWEPQDEVAARFAAAVEAHIGGGARHVVVASHGMAMTVWLLALGAVGESEAEAFWRGLRFPDAQLVDVEARTVRRWPPTARSTAG